MSTNCNGDSDFQHCISQVSSSARALGGMERAVRGLYYPPNNFLFRVVMSLECFESEASSQSLESIKRAVAGIDFGSCLATFSTSLDSERDRRCDRIKVESSLVGEWLGFFTHRIIAMVVCQAARTIMKTPKI